MRVTWLLPFFVLVVGCGTSSPLDATTTTEDTGPSQTQPTGPTEPTGHTGTPTETATSATGATADTGPFFDTGLTRCRDDVITSTVPTVVVGTTLGAANDQSGDCGGGKGEDFVYGFTAPTQGEYRFELSSDTAFDAVMYLRDRCGGREITCADAGRSGAELVRRELFAGQYQLLFIDGAALGEAGEFTLTVALIPDQEATCGDGVDQDYDGLTDCRDDDCVGSSACVEDCTDGKDDNDDGNVDCADPNCAADSACYEDCNNGVDDNGSGSIDCEDVLQCASAGNCVSQCPDAASVTSAPATVHGSTVTNYDDTQPTCGIGSAGDAQVQFTAPSNATYVIDTVGSDFDTVLGVYDTCFGTQTHCNERGPAGPAHLTAQLTVGQIVTISVDGQMGAEGAFTLNIAEREASETACFDGRDLDDDGAVDCEDTDCDASDGCTEDCANSIDDDVDGTTDCLDTDCVGDLACAEDCTNGVDDNGTGNVDCADPNCAGDPAC